MPIYEYTCTACEQDFEKLVFSGEEDGISCPKCRSKEVKKKMSAASFMGSGLGKCTTNPSKGFS